MWHNVVAHMLGPRALPWRGGHESPGLKLGQGSARWGLRHLARARDEGLLGDKGAW